MYEIQGQVNDWFSCKILKQLKQELKHEYLGKRSTIHLQIEFNSLKQRYNGNAQNFGRRVNQLVSKCK